MQFKRLPTALLDASHIWEETTLTERRSVAGGSGIVSTEAIIINALRTQIMYEFSLMPALHPTLLMITELQRR